MWPWESVPFAYLCYSPLVHLRYREPPTGAAVVLAGIGSVVPDVIDKPLSWEYGVFSSGYALGHSVFVSLLVLVLAHAVARRTVHPKLGLAFGIGYLSHNVGDVLEHVVEGHVRAGIEYVLWPIYVAPAGERPGFATEFESLLSRYVSHLVHLEFTPYLVLTSTIVVCAFLLWAYDGFPVLRELLGRRFGD